MTLKEAILIHQTLNDRLRQVNISERPSYAICILRKSAVIRRNIQAFRKAVIPIQERRKAVDDFRKWSEAIKIKTRL